MLNVKTDLYLCAAVPKLLCIYSEVNFLKQRWFYISLILVDSTLVTLITCLKVLWQVVVQLAMKQEHLRIIEWLELAEILKSTWIQLPCGVQFRQFFLIFKKKKKKKDVYIQQGRQIHLKKNPCKWYCFCLFRFLSFCQNVHENQQNLRRCIVVRRGCWNGNFMLLFPYHQFST